MRKRRAGGGLWRVPRAALDRPAVGDDVERLRQAASGEAAAGHGDDPVHRRGGTPLKIENMSSVRFRGVDFDGRNLALPDYAYLRSAFIALKQTNDIVFEDRQIKNAPGVGVYVTGGNAKLTGCYIASHSGGVFSEDAQTFVHKNNITMMANSGVETAAGGTGENGDGVNLFRAMGVNVCDNHILNVKYSAVRCNGGGMAVIAGNHVWNAREVAIYIEAPGRIIDPTGAVVSNNHLDTVGAGVTAETDCVISRNIIDRAQGVGIQLGAKDAARDLCVTGNLIRGSVFGIAVSNNVIAGTPGDVIVLGDIVRGAANRAVVPVSSNGTSTTRVGTADDGDRLAMTVGRATFGHNRAAA